MYGLKHPMDDLMISILLTGPDGSGIAIRRRGRGRRDCARF
jgi:hypothetical protein